MSLVRRSGLTTATTPRGRFTASPQKFNDAVLALSPQAFWSFDEPSGKGLADLSGYGNGGVWTSAPTRTAQTAKPGLAGKYVDRSSGSLYATVTDSSFMDTATSAITIGGWVNWSTNAIMQLCGRDLLSGSARQWQFRTNGNSVQMILFIPNSVTTVSVSGATNVRDSNWHLMIGTYDGSAARMYADSTQDGSTSASGSINAGTGEPIYLAASHGGGDLYNGLMDGFFLFSRALSAAEIASIYQAGRI